MIQMNFRRLSGGVFTCLICTAAPMLAQDATTRQDATRQQDPRNQQGDEQVEQAHLQLRNATMRALNEHSRKWQQKQTDAASSRSEQTGREQTGREQTGREQTGSDRNTASSSSSTATGDITLEAGKLMIAASPNGLLAGAPVRRTTTGSTQPFGSGRSTDGRQNQEREDEQTGSEGREATGASRTPSTSGTANSGQNELVGMILICKHKQDTEAARTPGDAKRHALQQRGGEERDTSAEEASSDRAATARAGSMRSGQQGLEPGAYGVKCEGDRVSLTDANGKVVLQATIEGGAKKGMNRRGADTTGDREETGRSAERTEDSRSARSAMPRTGSNTDNDGEWEQVFGAITAEIMTKWNSDAR